MWPDYQHLCLNKRAKKELIQVIRHQLILTLCFHITFDDIVDNSCSEIIFPVEGLCCKLRNCILTGPNACLINFAVVENNAQSYAPRLK